jgi:hypothetical protein
MTPHGFIDDTPASVNKYKNDHSEDWMNLFGSIDFELIEESVETSVAYDDSE